MVCSLEYFWISVEEEKDSGFRILQGVEMKMFDRLTSSNKVKGICYFNVRITL